MACPVRAPQLRCTQAIGEDGARPTPQQAHGRTLRQLLGRKVEEVAISQDGEVSRGGGARAGHGDLCGPITPATHRGRRYFILLVVDYSRYMWLQLLTSKDQAAEAIKWFKARAEAKSGKRLRILRTDCGANSPRWSLPLTSRKREWCATTLHRIPLSKTAWWNGKIRRSSTWHAR